MAKHSNVIRSGRARAPGSPGHHQAAALKNAYKRGGGAAGAAHRKSVANSVRLIRAGKMDFRTAYIKHIYGGGMHTINRAERSRQRRDSKGRFA